MTILKPKISIVAALSRNGVIGTCGKMPWHLPEDLARFKSLTMGKPVIMGRKTYQSIGRALIGRKNIVLSSNPDFCPSDALVKTTLNEAFSCIKPSDEVMVIGGTQLFREAIPLASTLYLTFVEAEIQGDTFFPPFTETEWELVLEETHPKDSRHLFAFTFCTLIRKK